MAPALFVPMAIYIFLSYAFYLPVLGMLMIPKTVMYLLMAGDCYKSLYRAPQREPARR